MYKQSPEYREKKEQWKDNKSTQGQQYKDGVEVTYRDNDGTVCRSGLDTREDNSLRAASARADVPHIGACPTRQELDVDLVASVRIVTI